MVLSPNPSNIRNVTTKLDLCRDVEKVCQVFQVRQVRAVTKKRRAPNFYLARGAGQRLEAKRPVLCR